MALGLETLDLAKTHEQALSSLISPQASPRTREKAVKQGNKFFAAAAIRIEQTHRAALDADALIRQLNQTLRQRTRESSASIRRLKQSVLLRQGAEEALKKSGKHHATLLAESHRLLQHLRQLTRSYLSAQEDDRKLITHQLQDELAQGLLGLHVRLLSLKQAMKASSASLKKEIGTTQRLVRVSTKKVKRFAYECGIKHKA